MILSKEQKNFIFTKKRIKYLQAFAGTGKTSTIKEYSKIFTNKSILYLSYNESVIKEAKKKFPNNVSLYTFHSFAYSIVGKKYTHKLKNRITPIRIVKALLMPTNNKSLLLAKLLSLALEKFFNSEFYKVEDSFYLVKEHVKGLCSPDSFKGYLRVLWNRMDNLENDFPITHDFYLKKLQLSNYEINYDAILIDECQDVNPTIKSIIFNGAKSDTEILLVGDKYQNIYSSFRYTENLFETCSSEDNLFKLTQTYRFGKKISKEVSKYLDFLGEKDNIVGNPNINSSFDFIDFNSQYAVISRNNVTLMGYAIKASRKNKKIFFLDNKKNENIKKLLDIYYLHVNERDKIKNNEIKKFSNIKYLEKFALENDLKDYIFFIELVKKSNREFEKDIININKMTVDNINSADIIFTTAHKSKGLEFSQVIMANDFYDPFYKNGKLKENLNYEELFIYYVAATRAIYNLKVNKRMMDMINYEKNK